MKTWLNRSLLLVILPLLFVAALTTTEASVDASPARQHATAYDADPMQGVPDNVLTDSAASANPVPSLGQVAGLVAAKSVATPQGPAIQSMTAEAQAVLRQAEIGAPVYRAGGLGTQRAAEGQYWSFQNPASTPGYANRMGMPGTGAGEPFIMGGRVRGASEGGAGWPVLVPPATAQGPL